MKPEVFGGSPQHPNMYKTLDLLKIQNVERENIYFIVEGLSIYDEKEPFDHRYFYEEHTCPTNFIRIAAIFTSDEDDPHGIFEYVRSVWMPQRYVDGQRDGSADEVLRELFPETRA